MENKNSEVIENKDFSVDTSLEKADDSIINLKSIINDEMKNGLDNIEMFHLGNESKEYPVDYNSIYLTTIHDTGTKLDDRNIDEVADSKKTTPKEIWNTMDVLKGVADGIVTAFANTFELGGEIATAITDPWFNVYENVSGEKATPKLTDEEKPQPFGSTELNPRSSYAGDAAAFLSQLAVGWKETAIKGAGAANAAIKTSAGAKMVKSLANTLHLIASDAVSMDVAKKNAAETVKEITGYSPAELLEKKEDDPYLLKKVKNAVADGPAYALIGGAFKLAGLVAEPAAKATVKTVGPVIKTALEPASKVLNKALEPLAKKIETPIQSAVRRIKEKQTVIKSESGEETLQAFAEAVENHKKMFTKEEVDKIVEQAVNEGTLSADVVKGANETVLRDVASSIIQLEEKGIEVANIADNLTNLFEKGEISQTEFNKRVIENFVSATKAAVNQKTAESGVGTALGMASKSETVKSINRLLGYISENADRIPTKKLNEYLSNLGNSKGLNALLDVAENIVNKGRAGDFVDKFTMVMQNVMLTSLSGRISDAVGSLANLGLQVLDAGTTGIGKAGIEAGKRAVRKVAGKKALATIADETDRVFADEALDMIHGIYSLFKETAIYHTKKISTKLKGGIYTAESPWQKARIQAINAQQSRLGMRYGDMKLMKGDSPVAQVVNYAFNHMGIWGAETIDDFIGTIAYRAHLERNIGHMAKVEGISNGWARNQIAKYEKESLKKALDMPVNPQKFIDATEAVTPEGKIISAIKRSAKESADTTFRSGVETSAAKAIYDFANNENWKRYTRILFPFQKVGLKLSIDEYLTKRSPLTAILGLVKKDSYLRNAWKAGGIAREEAIGKLANGLIIQGSIWGLMKEGKLTGPIPSDRNKYELLKSSGWMPDAYKRDDGTYVSLKNVTGPLEPMIKAITAVVSRLDEINERLDEREGTEFMDYAWMIPAAFAEGSLSGAIIGDFIEMVDKGDTAGVEKLRNNILNLAPPIINEAKDTYKSIFGNPDEFKQTALDEIDKYAQRWGVGDTYDELDLFGEPMWAVKRSAATLGAKVSTMPSVDTIDEMLRVKAYVSAPSQFVTKDGAAAKLTREQVYEWLSIMGELKTYDRIDMLVHSNRYMRAPEAEYNISGIPSKRKIITEAYNEQKEKAFNLLMKRNLEVKDLFTKAKERKKYPYIDEKYTGTYIPTIK